MSYSLTVVSKILHVARPDLSIYAHVIEVHQGIVKVYNVCGFRFVKAIIS